MTAEDNIKRRLNDDCFALPPDVEWTPVDVALGRLRDHLAPVISSEDVALADAGGRFLAEPAIARRASPPAANAAVDGYAVAWASLAGAEEVDLPLEPGRAAAGLPFRGEVPRSHAIRILTGAELPAGTDTVVLQEDAQVRAGRVRLLVPRKAGANSRGLGEDARDGDVVLEAGRKVGPAELARLASVGVDRIRAHVSLRVGVISTGDELVQTGADPGGPGIFDANRPMLQALIAAFGHRALDLGAHRDRVAVIRGALDTGAKTCDVILTTGGASSGDEDHISRLLRIEGTLETWRIAVKPGRPLALGLWHGIPVFGLPGNPVAAFVCSLIFARPALSVLAGAGWVEPQAFTVPSAFSKTKKPGRREYLRARMTPGGCAEVFHSEGSGLVGGLTWADGLVELADEAAEIVPGTPVRYIPFASFGIGG